MLISLFHIFIVAPLLIYVGVKQNLSHTFYQFLYYLGISIILFHLFKSLKKIPRIAYINYLHVLLFGPLLVYIGYNERNTPLIMYDMVEFIGVLALFYHLIKLSR
jgi:hypothetical protein